MGNPSPDIPSGTDMLGWPVKLAICVKGVNIAAR
jgi:hypothetical protein